MVKAVGFFNWVVEDLRKGFFGNIFIWLADDLELAPCQATQHLIKFLPF